MDRQNTLLPYGLNVFVSLPDGRLAVADGEDPGDADVVKVMERVHKRLAGREPAAPADYATITRWLDVRETRQ